MFDFLKWIAIGKPIYEAVVNILQGKSGSASVPISVKGHRFLMTITLDPVAGVPQFALRRL